MSDKEILPGPILPGNELKAVGESDTLARGLMLGEVVKKDDPHKLLNRSRLLYPELTFTIEDARSVIREYHTETMLDATAYLPAHLPLEEQANKGLYEYLSHLLKQQVFYQKMLEEGAFPYLPVNAEEEITFELANSRLYEIGSIISSTRKELFASKQVDSGNLSVNISMDKMVATAVNRIDAAKEVEAEVINEVKTTENLDGD